MRITVQENSEKVTIKLEGSASGEGLKELERTWRSHRCALGARKLVLDLRGVTFITPEAMGILTGIYQEALPEFQTSTLIAKHAVEEIVNDHKASAAKGAQGMSL